MKKQKKSHKPQKKYRMKPNTLVVIAAIFGCIAIADVTLGVYLEQQKASLSHVPLPWFTLEVFTAVLVASVVCFLITLVALHRVICRGYEEELVRMKP